MPFEKRSKSVLKKLGALAGIGIAAIISYEIFYWLTHVYEYDARIEAELTTLSSRIDGEIEKVHIKEGDRVKEGCDQTRDRESAQGRACDNSQPLRIS